MLCFNDRTFCTFGTLCQKSSTCKRVLTAAVQKEADEWWGKPNAPICVFADFPDCFIRFFEPDKEV